MILVARSKTPKDVPGSAPGDDIESTNPYVSLGHNFGDEETDDEDEGCLRLFLDAPHSPSLRLPCGGSPSFGGGRPPPSPQQYGQAILGANHTPLEAVAPAPKLSIQVTGGDDGTWPSCHRSQTSIARRAPFLTESVYSARSRASSSVHGGGLQPRTAHYSHPTRVPHQSTGFDDVVRSAASSSGGFGPPVRSNPWLMLPGTPDEERHQRRAPSRKANYSQGDAPRAGGRPIAPFPGGTPQGVKRISSLPRLAGTGSRPTRRAHVRLRSVPDGRAGCMRLTSVPEAKSIRPSVEASVRQSPETPEVDTMPTDIRDRRSGLYAWGQGSTVLPSLQGARHFPSTTGAESDWSLHLSLDLDPRESSSPLDERSARPETHEAHRPRGLPAGALPVLPRR